MKKTWGKSGNKSAVSIDSKSLDQKLKQIREASPMAATKALTACVLDLSAESAKRAPIELGDLRNNCHGIVGGQTVFEEQDRTPNVVSPAPIIEGSVGYSLPYALRQHEDLTMRHDREDGYRRTDKSGREHSVNMVAGGEAKYLENPFRERAERYKNMFKSALKEVLKK